jgi:hypothetical protein
MRHLIPSLPDQNQVPPIILQHPQPYLPNGEDPKTTIAALIAQVAALKAENRSLTQRLLDLTDRSLPPVLPPDPVRAAVVFQRNRRGHYIRERFWAVKEDTAMVKACLRFLKWTALLTFGFMLALLMAAGFDQASLVNLMIQIAAHSWKPIAVMAMVALTIAWMTEAV